MTTQEFKALKPEYEHLEGEEKNLLICPQYSNVVGVVYRQVLFQVFAFTIVYNKLHVLLLLHNNMAMPIGNRLAVTGSGAPSQLLELELTNPNYDIQLLKEGEVWSSQIHPIVHPDRRGAYGNMESFGLSQAK